VILSFLLPKNQRSSLYFQNKASLKIKDPLFFTSKKSAILSLLLPKKGIPKNQRFSLFLLLEKQHRLYFYLKKQHPPKNQLFSLFLL